jgi:hypothetical protein
MSIDYRLLLMVQMSDIIPLEVSRIDCMKVYAMQIMLWIGVWKW